MQGNMFISAGSTKADDDVRVASAPYGQLLDKNALKPLLSGKRFDCTRNGASLALWLELVDKAIHANPSVSKMWQGFSDDDTVLAEQSLPGRFWRFWGPESELKHHPYVYTIGYQAKSAGRGVEWADSLG